MDFKVCSRHDNKKGTLFYTMQEIKMCTESDEMEQFAWMQTAHSWRTTQSWRKQANDLLQFAYGNHHSF